MGRSTVIWGLLTWRRWLFGESN